MRRMSLPTDDNVVTTNSIDNDNNNIVGGCGASGSTSIYSNIEKLRQKAARL